MYANEAMRQNRLHNYRKLQIVLLFAIFAIGALALGGGATTGLFSEIGGQISHLLSQS
jgi:hypothetical protein